MKRRAARHLMEAHGLSERRACRLARLDRSTFQYRKRDAGDERLWARLRDLAGERRRFGYRHLGILLAQEGAQSTTSSIASIVETDEGLICAFGLALFGLTFQPVGVGLECRPSCDAPPNQSFGAYSQPQADAKAGKCSSRWFK